MEVTFVGRPTRRGAGALRVLLVSLAATAAVVLALLGVVPASAAVTAPRTCDTAAYIYDASASSSIANATSDEARGSPSGLGATSWGRSVFDRNRGVAANNVTRSLDDVVSLRGATTAEVEALIPSSWVKSATSANKGGLGIRYSNPERLGEQIRIMPGKVTDPNPLKQGPYVRISRNGTVTDPIPLLGNPTL